MGCLWGGHQFWCGRICSLLGWWVFYSGGGCSTKGCRWQLSPRHAVLRDRGWGCGEVCCSCSKAPWIWRLRVSVILGWGSMEEKRGGAGVVLIASGFVLHRSISIMEGSQAASPMADAFQSGSYLKWNTKALSHMFSPPGQTTCFQHCSNTHACNWWRRLQGFLWGLPSVRMPRCPSLDSGTCSTALFIQTKAYSQSRPSSASNTRHWAASTRHARCVWQGCTHTAIRPETLLHLTATLGAIRRKAISFLGFFCVPPCTCLGEGS